MRQPGLGATRGGQSGAKFCAHQQIIGGPTFVGSRHRIDDEARDSPLAAQPRTEPLAAKCDGYETQQLKIGNADVFESDAADAPPEAIRRVDQQGTV